MTQTAKPFGNAARRTVIKIIDKKKLFYEELIIVQVNHSLS